ncbi:MAG: sugar phosphate isomerase/epimerase [Verrucomicrobiaceae bacterium]|nr:sugar phosphate isomerase/epimerase [Verrucomicrobiaceae bacterium]
MKIALASLTLITALASAAVAAEPLPESAKVGFFYAGCQIYTFKEFPVLEALDKIAQSGGKTVEFFPGQKLNGGDDKTKFDQNTTPEQRAPVKAKLKELGLTPVGFGVVGGLGKDEESTRKVFEFCKDMGIGIVVAEPTETKEAYDIIEKLVKEFDIKMAIHNHPKNPLKRDYKYWDPEYVLSWVKDRDPRLGSCADIGHFVRSGIKPVDAIRILKGRIFDSHVKDLDAFGVREAKDQIWGTGKSDIPAVLNLYAEIGFHGPLDVEWEKDWLTSQPDVAKCLEWLKNFKPAGK